MSDPVMTGPARSHDHCPACGRPVSDSVVLRRRDTADGIEEARVCLCGEIYFHRRPHAPGEGEAHDG